MSSDPGTWLKAQAPYNLLDPGLQAYLESRLQIVYFESGSTLSGPGQRVEFVWIVRRGAVRRVQPGPDVVIEEGESIGGSHALHDNDELRVFDLEHVCLDATLCYQIPVEAFRRLAVDSVEFRQAVLGVRRPSTYDLTITIQALAGPPVWVDATATVGEAARRMTGHGVDALLVTGLGTGKGILTTSDLRSRVLAENLGPSTPVAEVATADPVTISPTASVAEAMLMMLERDIHHLPLRSLSMEVENAQDAGGGLGMTAIVSDHDILAHHGADAFGMLRRLVDNADDGPDRHRFAEQVAATVTNLRQAGFEPRSVARTVTTLVDGLTRSLVAGYQSSHGSAPRRYAFCASGSQGRREQTILTDQDNFLVYDDAPVSGSGDANSGDEQDVARWFEGLASHVISGLIEAGIPSCDGGYMATNWLGPLSWWQQQLGRWSQSPTPEALVHFNVFADLRRVAGELPEERVWSPLIERAGETALLRHLTAEVMRFKPPGRLSRLFGRDDTFDIKRDGLVPIVGTARILGLEVRLTTASTISRLEAAASEGLISDDAAAWMSEGHGLLTGLRTKTQLEALAQGTEPTGIITRSRLDPVDRSVLTDVLRSVAAVQSTLADRLGVIESG